MFSKDMKSINQILLCDQFSIFSQCNGQRQLCVWFCQAIYSSVTYPSKHSMHTELHCFMYGITTNHQINEKHRIQFRHRCVQAIHIKKSGKNNFEIKPSPMAISQDKRRFSHPVHMLHESNFYFSRDGKDVKIYVAKKFDFYCG